MDRAPFFLASICAFALSGCWEGSSREVLATVLSTRGEVVYLSKGSTNTRPVNSETKVSVGSVLRTSSQAQLNLMLIPGALTQISGDSELKVEELKLTKDGNETGDAILARTARIELSRGGMVVLFDGVANFTIETSHVTVTVLPSCLFRLDVDGTRTRLTCVRGKLYVSPKSGQMVAVGAGHFQEWPSDQGSTSAAEDRRGQIDTTAALQLGRELRALDDARRDRLPF
jgi:FecR protein